MRGTVAALAVTLAAGRELKARFDSLAAMREGARRPEVWTYRSRPGDAVEFTGGELRLAFDEECRLRDPVTHFNFPLCVTISAGRRAAR